MLTADISSALGDYISKLKEVMPGYLAYSAHKAAVGMADAQKELAPIGETGALRNTIHAVPAEAEEGWKVAVATSTGVHYAFFQEYGTGYKGDPSTYDGRPIIHTDKRRWMYTDAQGRTQYGHPMEGRHYMRDGADPDAVAEEFGAELVGRLNA